MDEMAANSNNGLQTGVSDQTLAQVDAAEIRTPPGMNFPDKVAPDGGTIRGSAHATPGLVLNDSLITAV
jgi:hypothetical protein